MTAWELKKRFNDKPRISFADLTSMAIMAELGIQQVLTEDARAMYAALDRGLSFKLTMGNILTLTPPLIITREQMDEAIGILDECLGEVR